MRAAEVRSGEEYGSASRRPIGGETGMNETGMSTAVGFALMEFVTAFAKTLVTSGAVRPNEMADALGTVTSRLRREARCCRTMAGPMMVAIAEGIERELPRVRSRSRDRGHGHGADAHQADLFRPAVR